jgi:hypothetical protein
MKICCGVKAKEKQNSYCVLKEIMTEKKKNKELATFSFSSSRQRK